MVGRKQRKSPNSPFWSDNGKSLLKMRLKCDKTTPQPHWPISRFYCCVARCRKLSPTVEGFAPAAAEELDVDPGSSGSGHEFLNWFLSPGLLGEVHEERSLKAGEGSTDPPPALLQPFQSSLSPN